MPRFALKFIVTFLMRVLDVSPSEGRTELSDEQKRGLFATMYANESMRRYLYERERYLIDNGMSLFLDEKLQNARGLAGQLLEVRTMRIAMKAAHKFVEREREDKKRRALGKGDKEESSTSSQAQA